jgi:hypothetical protein
MKEREGFLPYLAAALVGGLGGYGAHLAAKQTASVFAPVVWPVLFFITFEMGFAVFWRLLVEQRGRATPGVIYGLALSVAAAPFAALGIAGANLGIAMAGGENNVAAAFGAEVVGFLIGFGVPIAPISWLLWRTLAVPR